MQTSSVLLVVGLLGAASGFVCPPTVDGEGKYLLALKGENEQCGGACDGAGICGEGLKCITPKTSQFSFAILLTPNKEGICIRVEGKTVEVKAGRQLVGGNSDVDVNDEGVVGAAKFATSYVQSQSNSLPKPTLGSIMWAQKQVVAGLKYTLALKMADGHAHRITVVDCAWCTPRYQVGLFEPNALD